MEPAPGLALVVVSPRVAPGLMSRSAWQVVEAASVRLCADADEPLAVAVTDADLPIQVYAAGSPALLARHLVERAADDNVVWLGSADGDEGLSDAIADEVSRLNDPPPVEVVVGSWDVPGARLLDVVAVMDRLRSPGGCPWDAEQTHEPPAVSRGRGGEYAEAVRSGTAPTWPRNSGTCCSRSPSTHGWPRTTPAAVRHR